MACWASPWSWGLDSGGPSLWLPCSVQPPPSCVLGAGAVPFLQPWVCEGPDTSRRCEQNAGERCFVVSWTSRSRILQSLVCCPESDGRMETCHRSALSHYVTLTPFRMEVLVLTLGLIRKSDAMFSIDLKEVYVQKPIHPNSDLPPYHHVKQSLPIAFCFDLPSAPRVFNRVFSLM